MKGDIVNAAFVLAIGIVWAICIHEYFSPFNQCVRARVTITSDPGANTPKYPESVAKIRCAEALGNAAR